MVTEGTLDDPADAGRIQTDDAERVRIWGDGEQVLHTPPPAAELPGRIEALCAFLTDDSIYLPPGLRAITAHFMLGHDHYFADGNGRTARAVCWPERMRASNSGVARQTCRRPMPEGAF